MNGWHAVHEIKHRHLGEDCINDIISLSNDLVDIERRLADVVACLEVGKDRPALRKAKALLKDIKHGSKE